MTDDEKKAIEAEVAAHRVEQSAIDARNARAQYKIDLINREVYEAKEARLQAKAEAAAKLPQEPEVFLKG